MPSKVLGLSIIFSSSTNLSNRLEVTWRLNVICREQKKIFFFLLYHLYVFDEKLKVHSFFVIDFFVSFHQNLSGEQVVIYMNIFVSIYWNYKV